MSAVVTSGVPPETQMHMLVSLLHHLLSTVPPSAAQSEAIHAWLAGLVGSLTLGGEETSCSFSDRVFGNPKGSCQGTAEISGVAEEDAEVAIAAKTKKTAAKKPGQEGVSELGSGGANKDAEVAIASKTKKADAKKPDQEEPGTGGAKKPAEKKAAGKKAPKTNPAPSRRTSRLTVLKTKARQ
jgi:hypothetical protein